MKYDEIREQLANIRKKKKQVLTNIIPSLLEKGEEYETYIEEGGIVFLAKEKTRTRGFFAVIDFGVLNRLLNNVRKGVVFEYIYKEEHGEKIIVNNTNLSLYTIYVRSTITYSDNFYLLPETGRREILPKLYNPNEGEYAQASDVDELYELMLDSFDPLCDDIISKERWEQYIERNEVKIVRENGRIITFYVWRQEGKKVYSNMSVNIGPANLLYSLERSVFEEKWGEGIKVWYAWYNMKNTKSTKRVNKNTKTVIDSIDYLYNAIFIS